MIPKIIHYCWFGCAEKPEKIKRYIEGFHKLESVGFKIIEWNEENYNIRGNNYLIKAYDKKKWAHVSDFVRLDVLYKYGGIYLDTDVEIISDFESLLSLNLFMGFMWDCNLGTAVIGASKENDLIYGLKNKYNISDISLTSPNNDLFTNYFMLNAPGFKLNGKEQMLDNGIKIFEKNVFEHPSLFKRKNITIHHFSQSWKNGSKVKMSIKKVLISLIGLYIYRRYICMKSLKLSPFYENYKRETGK